LSPLSCFKNHRHNDSVKPKPTTDPLLQSRAPVQARYGTTTDVHPRPDPAAPMVPTSTWAATSPADPPQTGTTEANPPAPFRWASEKREQTTDGKTRGLEGKLEKAGDQWLLRSEAAPQGKVILEGHPRLDLFEEGDVIRIEGQMLPEGAARPITAWLPFRVLTVERVQLVKRGK